jgi:hypothetical protein
MRKHQWRSLLVVCLVLGLATAVSPNAGLVVGWFIAMYVVIRLFFVDHPVVWWYDALFFGVAVGIALLGAGVFAGVCAALPLTGITTRSCRTFSVERAILANLWTLCLMGGVFWFSLRLWLWWKFRKRE